MTNTAPQSEDQPEAEKLPPQGDLWLLTIRGQKRKRILKVCKVTGYRIYRLFGELTAIVLGFALFWVAALNVVLARGTVDISPLNKNAALWFSEAFNGRDAIIGSMTLDWQPQSNAVIFRANNVSVTDAEAREIQHIDTLTSEIGIGRILSGQLDPRKLYIEGGAVTWKRDANGEVMAGLGTPETVGKLGPVWTGRAASSRERGVFSLGGLETVSVANAVAYLQNDRDGVELQLSDTYVDVNNIGKIFEFKVKSQIITGEMGASLAADLKLSSDFKDFDFTLNGENLNPKALGPKRGSFSGAKAVDAPVDLDIRIIASRETGLNQVDVSLEADAGHFTTDKIDRSFDNVQVEARYEPVIQTLKFTNLQIKADGLKVSGAADLLNIGTPSEGFFKENVNYALALSEFKLDAGAHFDRPFDLDGVEIAGKLNPQSRNTDFTRLDVDFGNYQTDMSGSVRLSENWKLAEIAVQGAIDGVLSPEDLLSLWPSQFALGARRWIERAILKADLINFKIDLNIPEAALKNNELSNENLDLRFDVENADIRYISTMTPLTDASGSGRLRGNAFDIVATGGSVGSLVVDRGTVNIPRLNPKGGDLIIDVDGHGDISALLGLIDEKPFEFVSRFGVVPEEFSGTGEINLKITRPLLENFDRSRIEYSTTGTFTNVSAPFSLGAHKVTNGQVTLKSDKMGLRVEGPVQLGPWTADLNWEETFDNGATPSRFKISGNLDRDDLDGFGIGFREYFSGEIALSVDAVGNGIAITGADIKADLVNADIQIGPYWAKAKGIGGGFIGKMSRTDSGEIFVRDMAMTAPGLKVQGDIDLAHNMRLINLALPEAKIDNFIDATVQAKPDLSNEQFSINVVGKYLDISPFISNSMGSQSSNLSVPLLLTADLEKLTLRPEFALDGAKILFAHDGQGINRAHLRGQAEAGPFALELTTNEPARIREVQVDIPDAAAASKAFLGLDNISGGKMTIEAGLPLVGDEGPLQGTAKIDEFTLVKAPALAQMLSMASLQGLGDTLGGTGISFDRFEVPFTFHQGQFSVRNARVSGPAIGLTGEGDFDLATRELDFDGVLVPAYSANSVLGDIPLIGDLLVGKEGEGIFALTYTVKGTTDKMNVAVNPLSALTPGFLRGIFKPSRPDIEDVELLEEIESVKPNGVE